MNIGGKRGFPAFSVHLRVFDESEVRAVRVGHPWRVAEGQREERRKEHPYSSLRGYDEAPLGCRRNRERQLGILHGGAVMCLLDSPSVNFCLMTWLDFKQIPEI